MNARTLGRTAATTLGVVGITVALMGPAAAGPTSDGCPAGYSLMNVSDLAPQGYQVPGQVDDPTSGILSFGRPGNGDGRVCALELGNQTTSWGGQLYNFWDNTLAG
jgi:hypothetical protein